MGKPDSTLVSNLSPRRRWDEDKQQSMHRVVVMCRKLKVNVELMLRFLRTLGPPGNRPDPLLKQEH